jgi:hypothetical protein
MLSMQDTYIWYSALHVATVESATSCNVKKSSLHAAIYGTYPPMYDLNQDYNKVHELFVQGVWKICNRFEIKRMIIWTHFIYSEQ